MKKKTEARNYWFWLTAPYSMPRDQRLFMMKHARIGFLRANQRFDGRKTTLKH